MGPLPLRLLQGPRSRSAPGPALDPLVGISHDGVNRLKRDRIFRVHAKEKYGGMVHFILSFADHFGCYRGRRFARFDDLFAK